MSYKRKSYFYKKHNEGNLSKYDEKLMTQHGTKLLDNRDESHSRTSHIAA